VTKTDKAVLWFRKIVSWVLLAIAVGVSIFFLMCLFGIWYYGWDNCPQQIKNNAWLSGGLAFCQFGYYFIARHCVKRTIEEVK
jgi:hypothetical protein